MLYVNYFMVGWLEIFKKIVEILPMIYNIDFVISLLISLNSVSKIFSNLSFYGYLEIFKNLTVGDACDSIF